MALVYGWMSRAFVDNYLLLSFASVFLNTQLDYEERNHRGMRPLSGSTLIKRRECRCEDIPVCRTLRGAEALHDRFCERGREALPRGGPPAEYLVARRLALGQIARRRRVASHRRLCPAPRRLHGGQYPLCQGTPHRAGRQALHRLYRRQGAQGGGGEPRTCHPPHRHQVPHAAQHRRHALGLAGECAGGHLPAQRNREARLHAGGRAQRNTVQRHQPVA